MTRYLYNLFLTRTKSKVLQCVVLCFLWNNIKCFSFLNITSTVFDDSNSGVIAAFGDFNSDKITDLFRIVNKTTVDVLIGHTTAPLLRSASMLCSVLQDEEITSVMPGDFNGDSMMDLLITVKKLPDVTNNVLILWGSLNKLNCTNHSSMKVKTQPLLLDYNGDMIPDLFAVDEKGLRAFWIAQRSGQFIQVNAMNESQSQELSFPHFSSFTDLDLDGVADLFITGEKNIEYWCHENGKVGFQKNETHNYPDNMKVQGMSLFVDLNTDGILEHVLPVCHDSKCSSCSVMARSLNDSEWHVLVDKFVYKEQVWCFFLNRQLAEVPVSIRSGDFNLDGYPDFVTILQNQSDSYSGIVLLRNIECTTGNCSFGRKLEPIWDLIEHENLGSVQLAAFYDIYGDGILDLLITTQDKSSKEFKIHAIQNLYNSDAYFIKVIVIGGLCEKCPEGHAAYGTNQPGPYIKYVTTKSDSSLKVGVATQMYQTAHFALQLPYVVFGLGQIPNFVDSLQITIPGSNQSIDRQRTWTQLIPNSQMVVIPHPSSEPHHWLNKLFITPSNLVLMTLAALVGTCLFIGLIIGTLHWKERREDRREKLLEAHRFHFDAM